MELKIANISPEWANRTLTEENTGNRRMRRWWTQALAAAMRRGEWITTHQGIAFTADGRLLDGQHRLQAIVIADMPVKMAIFTNVPNDAFKVLDIGVKRTISDSTGMSKKTSEVCRLAANMVFGGAITPQQAIDIGGGGIEEVSDRLNEYCSATTAYYSSAPMRLSACLLVMDGHKEDYVFDIYRKLVLQHTHDLPPVGHAFSRQVNTKTVKANGKTAAADTLARGLKVLNPKNNSLSRVQIGDDESMAALAFARHIIRRSIADLDPITPPQHPQSQTTPDLDWRTTRQGCPA